MSAPGLADPERLGRQGYAGYVTPRSRRSSLSKRCWSTATGLPLLLPIRLCHNVILPAIACHCHGHYYCCSYTIHNRYRLSRFHTHYYCHAAYTHIPPCRHCPPGFRRWARRCCCCRRRRCRCFRCRRAAHRPPPPCGLNPFLVEINEQSIPRSERSFRIAQDTIFRRLPAAFQSLNCSALSE